MKALLGQSGRRRWTALVWTGVALTAVIACEKKEDSASATSAVASASSVPTSSAASAVPTSAPPSPAEPASTPVEKKCPDPSMTWVDNPADYFPVYGTHCKGAGGKRMVVGVWDGKLVDSPGFKLTNKAPVAIGNFHYFIFAYDRAGKRMDWPKQQGSRKWGFEGNLSTNVINPGGSEDKHLGPKKDDLPPDAATLEIEFDMVKWKASDPPPPWGWHNPDLVGPARPKGGVK